MREWERMDTRDKNARRLQIASCVLMILSVLVVFVTHRAVPFMMDDLWYSTVLYEDAPISSLRDIINAQIWHYNNWGGRTVTHTILQLTLLAGESAADILNVIFTLLLAGMLCLVSENRRPSAYFAGFAMLLGLNANWRMSMFWQAGAANYLYITVFILLFCFCYLRELPDKRLPGQKPSPAGKQGGGSDKAAGAVPGLKGITLWIVPLGILAGWSNENMGPAVWILSLVVTTATARERRQVKPWMILGSISCLLGSVMCIAAPGNFVRNEQIEASQYGFIWKLFLRSYGECRGALEYLCPTLLVLGAVLLAGRFVMKQPLGRRNILLLFCALLSWGAFLLSPHYPDRAAFGTMALCICVILSMAKRMIQERRDLAFPLFAGALFIWMRGMYFCGEFLALCWGWIK